jgi:hypothetical protein
VDLLHLAIAISIHIIPLDPLTYGIHLSSPPYHLILSFFSLFLPAHHDTITYLFLSSPSPGVMAVRAWYRGGASLAVGTAQAPAPTASITRALAPVILLLSSPIVVRSASRSTLLHSGQYVQKSGRSIYQGLSRNVIEGASRELGLRPT